MFSAFKYPDVAPFDFIDKAEQKKIIETCEAVLDAVEQKFRQGRKGYIPVVSWIILSVRQLGL